MRRDWWVDVNLADQLRNASCKRFGLQVSVKLGGQMMPSEVLGDDDPVDVQEICVPRLEPKKIRVIVLRFREKRQEKAGDAFRRNCYLEKRRFV